MDYEVIKIDAELQQCPETGVRYFGYVKYRDATSEMAFWDNLMSCDAVPWYMSVEDVLEAVRFMDYPEVLQVIILKAELPIKKLVINNEQNG